MSESFKENNKGGFSAKVKDELFKELAGGRHCRIAELAAITCFCGLKDDSEGNYYLDEINPFLVKKYFTLLDKTISISRCKNFIRGDEFQKISELIKNNGGGFFARVNDVLLQQDCCRKAFLRGAFLAAGSVSDPNKSYYLSIASENEALSLQVCEIFKELGIPAKITKRRSHNVVYIKEGTLIVEALGVMGAPLSLMEFENARIIKDIRNNLNRKVNAEAANLHKTVRASLGQIADIEYIDKKIGLSELPDSLREVAILRRNNPEVSLSELGQMLNPGIGKSGINHRLRRISRLALDLRKEEKENEKRSSS